MSFVAVIHLLRAAVCLVYHIPRYSMHFSYTRILAGLSVIGLASCKSLCSTLQSHTRLNISSNTNISCNAEDVRWSDFAAPRPGAIVTVGCEDDVAKLVTFANQNNIEFLLQSGGNGWADTFTIGSNDFIIDISQLKDITFNAARTEVTFQAGVVIKELVAAAYANNARVGTGTCNCVSVLGAALGGGLSREQGLYGQGVDQLLSINYVNAYGVKGVVTAKSNPDLWFAFTGAGANFGIVTSVVFKAHPVAQANNTAWTGNLIYAESQLEALMTAINELVFEPEMQLDFTYTEGVILVIPFYIGSEAAGMEKFASLLELGPTSNETAIAPYDEWNSAGDPFCVDGGRKPTYGINLQEVDPSAWIKVYNEYISFIDTYAEANLTTILSECYAGSSKVAGVSPSVNAFPWRDFKCYVAIIAWYTDESLDDAANEFGQNVRSYLNPSSTEFSRLVFCL